MSPPRRFARKSILVALTFGCALSSACNDSPITAPIPIPAGVVASIQEGGGGGTVSDTIWAATSDTGSMPTDSAWLATDRDDYSPGSVLGVLGGGWTPGEVVELVIQDDPAVMPPATVLTTADSGGSVSDQTYAITDDHLNKQFRVTATGRSSGRTASAHFADGISGLSGPMPNSSSTAGGAIVHITGAWSHGTRCRYSYWYYYRCESLSFRVRFGTADWVDAEKKHYVQHWAGPGINVQVPPGTAGTVDVTVEENECKFFWTQGWRGWSWQYRCWTLYHTLPRAFTYVDPNRAPTILMPATFTGSEGASIAFTGVSATDLDGDNLSYVLDFGDGSTPATGTLASTATRVVLDPTTVASHTYGDDGTYTLQFTISDGKASPVVGTAQVIVGNVAPTMSGITLPSDPVPVGMEVTAITVFSDAGWLDTHTSQFQWDWDPVTSTSLGASSPGVVTETNGAGSAEAAHTYTAAGVYTVRATVTDDDHATVGSGESSRVSTADVPAYIVVYDPAAGFVTGGGWIDSPAGACRLASCTAETIGKATFGFVSRYKKGATTPDGNTEFEFAAAGVRFKSTSYQWLVVSGARGKYKGDGMINGASGFRFLLTAIDGQVSGGGGTDRFRIKIWRINADGTDGEVAYDNQMDALDDSDAATALGGGSIVIHSK